ncbi:MAG: glutathione S-transferase [Rubrivivax sp.]
MIVLCGFPLSNYYNKVKMAMLEKGIPFTEERVGTGGTSESTLSASPLGKVPFVRTPQGPLCESQVIVDWLEAAWPEPPLVPADPYAAAKVRELVTFIDLHLELVARELYPQAFFGGTVSDATKERVRKSLERHVAGFKRLARFSPYVAGEVFTLADCSAWTNLPLVGMATKSVLGEDLLAAQGVDWKGYARMVGERPSAVRITADRKADPSVPRAQ